MTSGVHGGLPRWHCGDGHTWLGDDLLNAAIYESITRFPHREMVYQEYHGSWFPVPADFVPPEFAELVEAEHEVKKNREVLVCALNVDKDAAPSSEVEDYLKAAVHRLSSMTASDIELVHEQATSLSGATVNRLGIKLNMISSDAERQKFHEVELVLETVRQMTTDGQHSFNAWYNGEKIGIISRGRLDKNIELGLLEPWREALQ